MRWVDPPETPESLQTMEIPVLPGTIVQPIITDAVLAGLSATQTLVAVVDEPDLEPVEVRPAAHVGAHRRPHPRVLTWGQTGAVAALIAAVVFVGLLASGDPGSAPEAVRQAAPDAAVATLPHKAKPKPKAKARRPAARPARPVVMRSAPPAPTRSATPRPTVTVTVTPRPTPKPEPTPSPEPTVDPTPDPTPRPVETSAPETTPAVPDAAQTTEVPDDDA